MKFNTIIFSLIFILINTTHSQTADCNKIPFYPADHIRNPSLEQIGGFCVYDLRADTARGSVEMSMVIPFWKVPVKNSFDVDYFGVCNKFRHPVDPVRDADPSSLIIRIPNVPLPIPSGNGVIGLESQRSLTGTPFEEKLTGKEYISNNLFRVLKKDSLYRLDFALGFGTRQSEGDGFDISSSPVRFTLFGLRDSTKIPFANPSPGQLLGCLTSRFPDWIELGSVVIRGDAGTWQRGIIDFVAPAEIQTIAIGSACDFTDLPYTPRASDEYTDYYFIDDIKFFQASAPKPRVQKIDGGYCSGDPVTLRMTAANFYNGSALQWYKNNIPIPETSESLMITEAKYGPGWYQCGVRNDSVCIKSDSIFVYWEPKIVIYFGSSQDTSLCKGDTIVLKMSGGPAATYLWNDRSVDSSITITKTGIYSVKASNGCGAVNALKRVTFKDCPPLIYIPSAFTPNGDGLNEVFRVNATGRVKTFALVVYDRFGQKIFSSDNPAIGWDGTIKNKKKYTGLFIWMLQYTDGSNASFSKKGFVTLIR